MMSLIQKILILVIGVISGFGFYNAAVDINDKYTKEFFIFVGGEMSFGYEIVKEKLGPVFASASDKMAAVSESIEKDDEEKPKLKKKKTGFFSEKKKKRLTVGEV